MRRSLPFSFALLTTMAWGQVGMDVPLDLNGVPGERRIDGLENPISQDAALTVEASLLGAAHWAEATVSGLAITVAPMVPLDAYRTGQLLRFVAPGNVHGAVTLNSIGLDAFPVLRPDGIRPVAGQIRAGVVCEVLFSGDSWVLMNAPERDCPPGTIAINERACIETTGSDNMEFYDAAERCSEMGGRLCSWGEFYTVCTLLSDQVTGMLSSWEWLDDTSNHGHSSVQAGLANCTAQRWINPQVPGRGRCCFEPR